MARLLRMPTVAANAVEAVLSEWPVPENTPFVAGDAIATVETEKAVVDVPADADGVILKTLVPAGAEVQVGAPIALLGDPGEVVDDLDTVLAALGLAQESEPIAADPAADETVTAPVARMFSSPLARRLARDAAVSLSVLVGTGPGGRIVRRDVEQAIESRAPSSGASVGDRQPPEVAAAPVPAAAVAPVPAAAVAPVPAAAVAPVPAPTPYQDIPHTRMRRAIAARLTESSREAPHFFVVGTARVDKLLRLRARLNESGPVKISINDLVVMAAARAHLLVPAMNVIWMLEAVRQFSGVDVAVAVNTDRGLVTPVLRGVDQLTVSAVAAASSDLVGRARSGRLREEELVGGTLTVTNLGVFGTQSFAAIINPPQSAILAVGAARQEPVVSNGKLTVGTVIHFTLSVDHRPIDGAVAAQWMAAFLSLVAEPVRLLA